MLILGRKPGETVVIGGGGGVPSVVRVTVIQVVGNRVKLGFEADADVPVLRLELWEGSSEQRALQPAPPKLPEPWLRSD
jgi:carbon storage regulator CsrA